MALSLRLAQGITLIGDEDFPPFEVFQFLRLQIDPVGQIERLPQGRHGGPIGRNHRQVRGVFDEIQPLLQPAFQGFQRFLELGQLDEHQFQILRRIVHQIVPLPQHEAAQIPRIGLEHHEVGQGQGDDRMQVEIVFPAP